MITEKIGIDLGNKYIKIAVLKRQADIFNIKCAKTYPVKSGITKKEYFIFVKSCIKSFTKEYKIKSASLNFTMPVNSKEVGCSFLTMPVVNKKILSSSVKYEVEEQSLIDNPKSYYDNWTVVDKDDETNEQNILIEFIKIDLIEQLSKINGLTWKLESIELQVVTIGRLVHGNSIVIDFGHEATRIYAYRNGKPFVVENIPIGGKNLTELIEKEYPLIKDKDREIEDYKKQCYLHNEFLTEDEDPLKELSLKVTDLSKLLSLEIKRQVRNIELKKEYFVENIYFTGGLSELRYFKEMISKDLDSILLPLKLISEVDGEDLQFSNPYTLAASASLFSRYKYFNEMNFANLANISIDFTSMLVLAICGALAIALGTHAIHQRYDNQIADYTKVIAEQTHTISTLNSEISNYDYNITSAQQTIDKVNSFTHNSTDLARALYIFSEIMPEEVSVLETKINEGVITLIGLSKDYSNIGFTAIALEKYGTVNIDYIENKVEGEKYSNNEHLMSYGFKITFTPTSPYFYNDTPYTDPNDPVDPDPTTDPGYETSEPPIDDPSYEKEQEKDGDEPQSFYQDESEYG